MPYHDTATTDRKTARDRITKMLAKQFEPRSRFSELGDIGRAMFTAMGSRQPYQTVRNVQQDRRLNSAKMLYDILGQAQGDELTAAQTDLARRRTDLTGAQLELALKKAAAFDPDAQAVQGALDDVPLEHRASVLSGLHKLDWEVDRTNAAVSVARMYDDMQRKNLLPAKPAAMPSGWRRTETGQEPIPGGPASLEYLGKKARATGEAGSLTTAQRRHNARVREARATLRKQGYSRARVLELTQEATATGRPNPDWNPFIRGLATTAADRLYGDDPNHAAYMNWLHSNEGEGYPPGYSAPAQPPPPPGPKPALGGPVARQPRGRVGGRFPRPTPGGGVAARVADPNATPRSRRGRSLALDVPMTAEGTVDTTALRTGALYRVPSEDGYDFFRWTGRSFEPIR